MKVTETLKQIAEKAQKDGYVNIYCVVGSYRATTYCRFHSIEKILKTKVGTHTPSRPHNHKGMWTGFPNTRMVNGRDIQYTRLFEKYKETEK